MRSSDINYDQLRVVNAAVEPGDNSRHEYFMKNFTTVFTKNEAAKPGMPTKTTKAFELSHAGLNRPKSRYAAVRGKITRKTEDPATVYDNPRVHDIRLHISRHKQGAQTDATSDDLVLAKDRNIGLLRLLLKKLPFERTRKEHRKVYRLLLDLWPNELSCLLVDQAESYPVLRELATVATLDTFNEAGLTVFGNTGLHMVLRGSVRPQTLPYIRTGLSKENDDETFPCPTPLLRRKGGKLVPGDWFGTLEKVEGREVNSKVMTSITLEPCLCLKISIADYKRILERIRERIQAEKTNAVQQSALYKNWPGLSLRKLAALIEWQTIPGGTVVFPEGAIAPFIMFLKKGRCEVFKQVEAVKTLPNGRRRRLFRSVLMGALEEGDSIGEDSLLGGRAIGCSIVSCEQLETGVITAEKLELLDPTTRTLLAQSARPKFDDVTDDVIHAKFVEQEMKEDWATLKRNVLLRTINHCGIRPGYGKWA